MNPKENGVNRKAGAPTTSAASPRSPGQGGPTPRAKQRSKPVGAAFDYKGLPAAIERGVDDLLARKPKLPPGWGGRKQLLRRIEDRVRNHAVVRLLQGEPAETLAVAVQRQIQRLTEKPAAPVAHAVRAHAAGQGLEA